MAVTLNTNSQRESEGLCHLKEKLTVNKTIRRDASVSREISFLLHIFNKAVE